MIKYQIRYGILFVILSTFVMQNAAAEGQAPFMEGSFAFLSTKVDYTNANIGSSSHNTSVFIYRLGLPILNYYAVEFVLGTGLTDSSTTIGDLDVNSILGVDFKASYPFGKGFEGFVRAGNARLALGLSSITVEGAHSYREVYNGLGITLGLGGTYDLGKFGKVFLEYQRFPNVDLDVNFTDANGQPTTLKAETQTGGFAIGYQFFIKI